MFATWSPAEEPNILYKNEIDCTKIVEFIESLPKEERPSITHYAIKVIADIMRTSATVLNGKIVWGKFIPFKTVDISCLVDIGGGEDLASVLIERCDEMSIKDI